MSVCTSCERYSFNKDEWYCQYCGDLRGDCPECGANVPRKERECRRGHAPSAPCKKCDEWIPANTSKCSECGFDINDQPSVGRVGLGGGLLISGLGVLSILLGLTVFPLWFSIFTFIPGGLLFIVVGLVFGGVFGLLGKGADKMKGDYAAKLSAAEWNQASEEYQEESKRAVKETAASAASAIGSAAEAYETSKENDSQESAAISSRGNQSEEERKRKRRIDAINKELEEGEGEILWQRQCHCGIPWAVTYNGRLIRTNRIGMYGFNPIDQRDWNYHGDEFRIQCDGPGCTNIATVKKETLVGGNEKVRQALEERLTG